MVRMRIFFIMTTLVMGFFSTPAYSYPQDIEELRLQTSSYVKEVREFQKQIEVKKEEILKAADLLFKENGLDFYNLNFNNLSFSEIYKLEIKFINSTDQTYDDFYDNIQVSLMKKGDNIYEALSQIRGKYYREGADPIILKELESITDLVNENSHSAGTEELKEFAAGGRGPLKLKNQIEKVKHAFLEKRANNIIDLFLKNSNEVPSYIKKRIHDMSERFSFNTVVISDQSYFFINNKTVLECETTLSHLAEFVGLLISEKNGYLEFLNSLPSIEQFGFLINIIHGVEIVSYYGGDEILNPELKKKLPFFKERVLELSQTNRIPESNHEWILDILTSINPMDFVKLHEASFKPKNMDELLEFLYGSENVSLLTELYTKHGIIFQKGRDPSRSLSTPEKESSFYMPYQFTPEELTHFIRILDIFNSKIRETGSFFKEFFIKAIIVNKAEEEDKPGGRAGDGVVYISNTAFHGSTFGNKLVFHELGHLISSHPVFQKASMAPDMPVEDPSFFENFGTKIYYNPNYDEDSSNDRNRVLLTLINSVKIGRYDDFLSRGANKNYTMGGADSDVALSIEMSGDGQITKYRDGLVRRDYTTDPYNANELFAETFAQFVIYPERFFYRDNIIAPFTFFYFKEKLGNVDFTQTTLDFVSDKNEKENRKATLTNLIEPKKLYEDLLAHQSIDQILSFFEKSKVELTVEIRDKISGWSHLPKNIQEDLSQELAKLYFQIKMRELHKQSYDSLINENQQYYELDENKNRIQKISKLKPLVR